MAKISKKVSHIEDRELKNGKVEFEDQVFRAFDPILESDEKIVKAYKPCSAKVYFSNIMSIVIPFLILVAFMAIVFSIPSQEVVASSEILIAILIPLVVFVLALIFVIITSHLYCKNTFYAYTNKRLIVRTGIFGVDFKCLDIANVTASNVYVSLFDKLLRKNTGTIKFGSESSPINGNAAVVYSFSHINEPYENYKKIKTYIEKQNSKKENDKEEKKADK